MNQQLEPHLFQDLKCLHKPVAGVGNISQTSTVSCKLIKLILCFALISRACGQHYIKALVQNTTPSSMLDLTADILRISDVYLFPSTTSKVGPTTSGTSRIGFIVCTMFQLQTVVVEVPSATSTSDTFSLSKGSVTNWIPIVTDRKS